MFREVSAGTSRISDRSNRKQTQTLSYLRNTSRNRFSCSNIFWVKMFQTFLKGILISQSSWYVKDQYFHSAYPQHNALNNNSAKIWAQLAIEVARD